MRVHSQSASQFLRKNGGRPKKRVNNGLCRTRPQATHFLISKTYRLSLVMIVNMRYYGKMKSRLVFVSESGYRIVPSGNRRKMGLFRCGCGKVKEMCISNVKRGVSRSCGCASIEQVTALGKLKGSQRGNYVHGMFGTKFYATYFGIVARTKGTTRFYEKVRNDFTGFKNFYDTMYQGYLLHIKQHGKRQTTIDRIDSSGSYSPQNCQWATYKEQARNRKNNITIVLNGEQKTLAEWSEVLQKSRWYILRMAENKEEKKWNRKTRNGSMST